MGLIKEPLNVDFTVISRPLTEKESLAISAFIKADKLKQQKKDERAATRKAKKSSKHAE